MDELVERPKDQAPESPSRSDIREDRTEVLRIRPLALVIIELQSL